MATIVPPISWPNKMTCRDTVGGGAAFATLADLAFDASVAGRANMTW